MSKIKIKYYITKETDLEIGDTIRILNKDNKGTKYVTVDYISPNGKYCVYVEYGMPIVIPVDDILEINEQPVIKQ